MAIVLCQLYRTNCGVEHEKRTRKHRAYELEKDTKSI